MGIKIRMRVHEDKNGNWMEDGDIERRIKIRIGINKMQITFNAQGQSQIRLTYIQELFVSNNFG